jgi:hypothetical protein
MFTEGLNMEGGKFFFYRLEYLTITKIIELSGAEV